MRDCARAKSFRRGRSGSTSVEHHPHTESETWRTKDKDKRTIPLTKAFSDFLTEEMPVDGELPEPFLIQPTKVRAKRATDTIFGSPLRRMQRQGISWVKPHVMRHTFASLLAIAGVSIFKIAQWLGDDVKVVEGHYAHLLPQDSTSNERLATTKPSPNPRSGSIKLCAGDELSAFG